MAPSCQIGFTWEDMSSPTSLKTFDWACAWIKAARMDNRKQVRRSVFFIGACLGYRVLFFFKVACELAVHAGGVVAGEFFCSPGLIFIVVVRVQSEGIQEAFQGPLRRRHVL